MRVYCPASPGEECRRPRRTSRGGWYLLDTGGELGGLATIQKPLIPHPLEIRPDFLALFRMSAKNQLTRRRVSDALVVNPKRAPGPKFNSAGGLKPLLQLERKAEFHAFTHIETYLPV